MTRPSDRELRAALATCIARVGTGPAQRLADEILHDRLPDDEAGIFECAERLGLDGNDLIRQFRDEVHEQSGHSLVPVGRLH